MKRFSLYILFLSGWIFPATAQTYDDFIDSSFVHIEKEDWTKAGFFLTQALKKEPGNQRNVMLLANLGTIQRRNGQLQDALISYNGALSRAPKNKVLLANRASLFSALNQPENAITDYTSVLLIDENNEDALYERGILYLNVKNIAMAQADFERILELNPKTLKGRKGIATICKLKGEHVEAEKIYTFLIDRVPDDPDLYLGRAEVFLLSNQNGRARNDINKAFALQEGGTVKDPYAYVLRAQVKIRQYEKTSAQNDLKEAISLGYDKEKAEELLLLCR